MNTFSVLVFHHAAGFVHLSIPDTVEAIAELGAAHDFAVTATDDPTQLTDDVLGRHEVVVFAHTTGNVVPAAANRRALEGFVRTGGGFVGIHAAASMADDVRDDWPWYVELIGSRFIGHTAACVYGGEPFDESPGARHGGPIDHAPPDAEPVGDGLALVPWVDATLTVEAPDHPAARGLSSGVLAEEWYGFDANPRELVEVVASVDESTYEPGLGAMGDDHPVIWWRDFDGGRSVYTSLGHARARWREPWFREHVLGCIELAAGRAG